MSLNLCICLVQIIALWEFFFISVFLMKETNASNPYRSVVIYAPPPPPKENTPSRFNISNMLNRIKWFYEAPVIRFYYNLVSIFFTLLPSLPHWMLSSYSMFRYSLFHFWCYSVMFFWWIIFHWISTAKLDLGFQICEFQSQKLFCIFACGVWLLMKYTRSVFFSHKIDIFLSSS
jgi:hypothetical protein